MKQDLAFYILYIYKYVKNCNTVWYTSAYNIVLQKAITGADSNKNKMLDTSNI